MLVPVTLISCVACSAFPALRANFVAKQLGYFVHADYSDAYGIHRRVISPHPIVDVGSERLVLTIKRDIAPPSGWRRKQ